MLGIGMSPWMMGGYGMSNPYYYGGMGIPYGMNMGMGGYGGYGYGMGGYGMGGYPYGMMTTYPYQYPGYYGYGF